MHNHRLIFRIIEADFNARRSDYSILEPHNIGIGTIEHNNIDFIDQRITAKVGEINFSKHGSYATPGPVGVGHYYRSSTIGNKNFNIDIYHANYGNILRSEVYSVAFLFISGSPDVYGRRAVIARARYVSGMNYPSNVNSIWLNSLNDVIDGYVDFELLTNINIHYYINNYSFMHGLYGKMKINHYNASLDDIIVMDDIGSSGSVGDIGSNTLANKLFNCPEACQ